MFCLQTPGSSKDNERFPDISLLGSLGRGNQREVKQDSLYSLQVVETTRLSFLVTSLFSGYKPWDTHSVSSKRVKCLLLLELASCQVASSSLTHIGAFVVFVACLIVFY